MFGRVRVKKKAIRSGLPLFICKPRRGGAKSDRGEKEPRRAEEEKPGKETFLCAGSIDETPGAAGQNRTEERRNPPGRRRKTGRRNPPGIGRKTGRREPFFAQGA